MKGAVGGEVFTIHIISRLLGSENSSAHLSRRVTERSGWGRPISSPGSSCSSAARSQLNLTFASFQEVRLKYCYGNISTTNYCSLPRLCCGWPRRDKTHARAHLNAPSLNVSAWKKYFGFISLNWNQGPHNEARQRPRVVRSVKGWRGCFQDPLSNSAPFNCTQLQKSFLVWNYSAALKCEIFYYVWNTP